MTDLRRKRSRIAKKDPINTAIRKKLGVTQAQLAAIFNVSRAYVGMAEAGRRKLHAGTNATLINMYHQFHQLETGGQSAYRSLETMLFLNDAYKKILPEMKVLEQDCRRRVKELKIALEQMKERARDAEHAIIVFTTASDNLKEPDKYNNKSDMRITGLNLFKQQAYMNLLTCWEPEQAKLHGKIEAINGEARALRRYRIKVMSEHNPFKK